MADTAMPSLAGRIRGMIHGVAFGDAMGAPVELLSPLAIRERYGRVTSLETRWYRESMTESERRSRVRGNGIVTDDTMMMLCLINIYADVQRHLDAWDMASGMVREIAWTPRFVPELQREAMLIERLFYPEKWIFQRHQLSSCDPRQGGIGNMVNCGAAMYIAPVGAVSACDPRAAYEEAIAFASGHQQSYGLEAAGVMAAAVAAAFTPGIDVEGIVNAALAVAKDGTRDAIADIADAARRLRGNRPDDLAVVAEFHRVIGRYSSIGEDLEHTADKVGRDRNAFQPSRRQSIEELPLALGFCLLNDGDFRRSVIDSINSGRDADSIGVMAGAILGAMHGEAIIDQDEAAMIDASSGLNLKATSASFTSAIQAIFDDDARAAAARHDHRMALAAAS